MAFIDAISSAKFVLAGAMHAAVTAAAYGVPFGFWDSESIDIPTKWEDIAGLINIPCQFFEDVDAASVFYEQHISPVIAIPSLWSLVCAAPGFLKATGVLKVLKYEMGRATDKNYNEMAPFIEEMHLRSMRTEEIAKVAKDNHDNLTNILEVLSADIDEAIPAIRIRDTEIESLRNANINLLEDDRSKSEKISSLLNNLNEYGETISSQSKRIDLLQSEVADHSEARRMLQSEIADLQAQIVGIQAAENAQVERAIEQLDASRQLHQQEIVVLKEQLSVKIAEERHQSESKIQELVNKYEVQLLAQDQARIALEADIGSLQAKIADIVAVGSERERHMIARFDELQRPLQEKVGTLKEQLSAKEADVLSGKQRIHLLEEEKLHAMLQVDVLRNQSMALVAQYGALQNNLTLAENESAARDIRADATMARYWHLLEQSSPLLQGPSILTRMPRLAKKSKILRAHCDSIAQFLEIFTEAELGHSRLGREERIMRYLLGLKGEVEDFPIFNRDIYLRLNPDVAEQGVEPFIHFIKNGQWESRIIHPTMDIPYYLSQHPEGQKFKISTVEHYIKFGVLKEYDPSPLFSTKWYLDKYPDVKISGVNPVIHYLRNPGCEPHPEFESSYYRIHNLDVVRQGVNPLVHYSLWGREEGRRPKAFSLPAVLEAAPVFDTIKAEVEQEPRAKTMVGPERAAANSQGSAWPTSTVMQEHPLPTTITMKPIVVMMDAYYPRPDEDSGSLDQVNFIRIFKTLGFDIAFISLLKFDDAQDTGANIAALGAHCVTAAEFSTVEEYLFLNQERITVLFLSRVHFGGAWIERARAFCPKARIIFNTVDLHHVREKREAELRGDVAGAEHAEETKRLEYACVLAADASIVVSEQEQKLLSEELPSARVVVVPLIREVLRTSFPDWHGRSNLAFIGGFQHQPNVDAVNYFLDEIWPLVRARRPGLVFHVIGSHLPSDLKERNDPDVEWVGYVPEIEPWLDKLRLTVAPLRYGAGAKGKVVSSLLNGVPCVATSIAVEGMGLQIGKDIVAYADPQEFADAIIRLHDDAEAWGHLSQHGFSTISHNYSIEYGQKCVEDIIQENEDRQRAQ
tara:strand:+ start:11454 stop:14717 length:3264 start_codon:yes stop_codon:yes gene_type:complete